MHRPFLILNKLATLGLIGFCYFEDHKDNGDPVVTFLRATHQIRLARLRQEGQVS